MASRHRWPSRWWFWGPVIGANLYQLALSVLPQILYRARAPEWVILFAFRVLVAPVNLFGKFVAGPVMEVLGQETFGPLTDFAIGLALWEILAAVLGLVCYGAVLLVYAIVPRGPDSGDRERGQLGH